MRLSLVLRLAACGCLYAAAGHADPMVQLIGSNGIIGDGNLSVTIGETGGWGFQITNDSTFWMGANLSDFCPSGVSTPPCDTNTWLLAGTDPFGPYNDLYGPDFVVVGPNSTVLQDYTPGSSGAGSISLTGRNDINVGDIQSGALIFVYDLYDADPNGGGNQIGGDLFMDANATVTAVGAGVQVPEPSTAAGCAAGLLGLLCAIRRRARG